MNEEHLLDAMGLLDDDLIREAERYSRPSRKLNYKTWLGWAACLAVVLVLGYGITHLRMGGGNSAAPENFSGGAAGSVPSASGGWESLPAQAGEGNGSDEMDAPDSAEPAAPGASGSSSAVGDWLFALRADGVVYWATEEYIEIEPEEVRYTTSFIDSSQPEEDGQASFLPVGSAYVVLDNGTAAVFQEDSGLWRVYNSVPPWEN